MQADFQIKLFSFTWFYLTWLKMDTLEIVIVVVLSALTALIILLCLCSLPPSRADVSDEQPRFSNPRSLQDVEAGLSETRRASQQVGRSYQLTNRVAHSFQSPQRAVRPSQLPQKVAFPTLPRGELTPPDQAKPPQIHLQLNEAAKFKHIDPNCWFKIDAERKSLERDSKYPQEVGEINTVFQVGSSASTSTN